MQLVAFTPDILRIAGEFGVFIRQCPSTLRHAKLGFFVMVFLGCMLLLVLVLNRIPRDLSVSGRSRDGIRVSFGSIYVATG